MRRPAISVIIPTHDRAATLPRTLSALARQDLPADCFEVVLVADGCQDDTVAVASASVMPFALRVLEQPALGAAAARNRGAAAARAGLLLFLDDDMEALPGLLRAHLEGQRDQPCAGLGYFAGPLDERGDDPLLVETNLWWDQHFSQIRSAGHRFSFRDLFSGNVCLPAAVFAAVGGFDEAFRPGRAGEDYELGIRLMRARLPFRFLRDAAALHHDRPTLARAVVRARAEGRGHAVIAAKYPTAALRLPLAGWRCAEGRRDRLLIRLARHPSLLRTMAGLATAPLAVARAAKLRGGFGKLMSLTLFCAYWSGVAAELGSARQIDTLAATLPAEVADAVHAVIDLADGLDRLAAVLTGSAVDAVALTYGGQPLLQIDATPYAEPLRLDHIRDHLVHHQPAAVLAALLGGEGRVEHVMGLARAVALR